MQFVETMPWVLVGILVCGFVGGLLLGQELAERKEQKRRADEQQKK